MDDGCKDYGCDFGTSSSTSSSSGYSGGDPDVELGSGGGAGYCDPILGCENPDAGIFCDLTKCWQDGLTVVDGTFQDPAIYISGGVACLATGLCLSLAAQGLAGLENLGWAALRACSTVSICLKLAIALGIYYPPNNGFVGAPGTTTLTPGEIITRYGPDGKYASPIGTSISARALPFHLWNSTISGYEVVKPFQVSVGTASSWYGLSGNGIQYLFEKTLETLFKEGYLIKLP